MDRFKDLTSAGIKLADELQEFFGSDSIVLGIANGGVPVAEAVAQKLVLPFDIAMIKRLFTPRGPMSPVCAFNLAGTFVVDNEVENISEPPATLYLREALGEFARGSKTCRDAEPATLLSGKQIILVDNGIQTGSTILALIRALRKLSPSRIITAVPVAAAEIRVTVEQLSDQVICLSWPENIGHVGLWYSDFSRPSDDQVREIFRRSRGTVLCDDGLFAPVVSKTT
jgi:predicted phosphoribosyltransferase